MNTLENFRLCRQGNRSTKSKFFDLLQFYSELYLRDKLTNGLDAGLRNEICCWSKELNVDLKKVNLEIDVILDQLFTGKIKYKYVDYQNGRIA